MALEYAKKFSKHVQKIILLNSSPTNSQERQQQSFAYFYETASKERLQQFKKDIAFLEDDIKKEPERRFVHMCLRMRAQSFYDFNVDTAYMWDGVITNMPIIDYLWGIAFGEMNLIQTLSRINGQ